MEKKNLILLSVSLLIAGSPPKRYTRDVLCVKPVQVSRFWDIFLHSAIILRFTILWFKRLGFIFQQFSFQGFCTVQDWSRHFPGRTVTSWSSGDVHLLTAGCSVYLTAHHCASYHHNTSTHSQLTRTNHSFTKTENTRLTQRPFAKSHAVDIERLDLTTVCLLNVCASWTFFLSIRLSFFFGESNKSPLFQISFI